jgi:hypothetical protein
MSAHTPGPWLVSVNRDFVDSKKHLIAQSLAPSAAERHANARLIAAAPELLSALRELLALGQQESIEDGELLDAQRAAVAAIRKATGGAP